MDRSKWEYKKLGELCDKGSSNIAQNKIEDITGKYPLYGASGYVKGIDFYHQEKPYIGIVKDGSGVGRTNLYPAKSSLLGTMQYIIPKDGCEIGFLLYVIKGLHLENYKTGAAIPHIYFKDYGKSIVPFPPLADQQRIVAELDCLNEMIALKQEQLKEFDKLAQSIFYDMFGDGNWKSRKIKDIAKVKIGPFGSSLHQYDYITGGTPLVNPIHMINGKIVVDNDFTITEEKKTELTSYLLKTNDIVFGRRGDIGRCALVTDKENGYLCGTGSMFVRFDIDIDPTYALCELSSKEIKKYLLDNAKGATMLNINGGIVENIPIPLPPLVLQQQFAEKIQAIEAQKELVKKSIAETQQLLDSRMDYYFD